jgi:hypothetical protein
MEGESLDKNRQKALARHDKFIMVLPSAYRQGHLLLKNYII